jgi:hypothetical protein
VNLNKINSERYSCVYKMTVPAIFTKEGQMENDTFECDTSGRSHPNDENIDIVRFRRDVPAVNKMRQRQTKVYAENIV